MKFAHMADLHLGGWRDPELEKINLEAFEKALDICISERVNFIIISGDLFDTSMPSFDILDFVSKKLNDLKRVEIPVYTIAGSHDYSSSGKTILKVFENAELIVNVAKGAETDKGKLILSYTTDKKTGVKITGIFGRKGSLDEEFYKNLDRSIENQLGYKIFLFHSGIEEYRPDYLKDVAAMPLSLLPKGFDYYAGGHIHHRSEQEYNNSRVVFPGPLFPCNFQELERFGSGGFYIVEDAKIRFVDLKANEVFSLKIDADNKSPSDIETEIEKQINSLSGKNYILLIRVFGKLKDGKTTDINFRRLSELAISHGAIVVRRSTNALMSKDYEEIQVSIGTIENIEDRLIKEHLGQSGMKNEGLIMEKMLKALDKEKFEGETTAAFESRLLKDADSVIS